jgi:hypothetical protein
LEHIFNGAESWTFGKIGQKYTQVSEILSWRMMEKISWNDRVRNEVVLQRFKMGRNILRTIEGRKAN